MVIGLDTDVAKPCKQRWDSQHENEMVMQENTKLVRCLARDVNMWCKPGWDI